MPDGDHAGLAVVPSVVDAIKRGAVEYLDGVLEGEAAVLGGPVGFGRM